MIWNIENTIMDMEEIMANAEILEQFNDLCCSLGFAYNDKPEEHPEWKQMEKDFGIKVTMNDVSTWVYLYLK